MAHLLMPICCRVDIGVGGGMPSSAEGAELEDPKEGANLGLTLEVYPWVSVSGGTLKPLYLFERELRRTSTVERGAAGHERLGRARA